MKKKNKLTVDKSLIQNVDRKSKKNTQKNDNDNMSRGISILNNYQQKIKYKRDERIRESSNEEDTEFLNKQKRYIKRRPLIFTFIILIILVFIYLFFSYGYIIGISLNRDKGISDSNRIDFASNDDDIYISYQNEFLIYSNQTLSTYNSSSSKTWEYRLSEMFTPKIYIQGRYMVVCNNSNGTIYLFENKHEILNKKLDGNIQNVYLDDNGNMAIEYSTSGYKKVIGVYSKNGKNIYNSYLSNGAIIDIKLLENARKLLVLQTDSSSFKIGTSINLIDGTKSSDNVKQIARLDNNFLFDLTIQGQNIIMLLDNKLISCNMDTLYTSEINSFDSSQFLYIDIYDNYYTYIEKALEGNEKYDLVTKRFDNSIISTLSINTSPKVMRNSGFLTYVVYQDKLQVVNKWGVEIKNVPIDMPPKDMVIFNNSKSVAFIYTNKVYILNM